MKSPLITTFLLLCQALLGSPAEASSQFRWAVEGVSEGVIQIQQNTRGAPAALTLSYHSAGEENLRRDIRLSELNDGVELATFGPISLFSLRSTTTPGVFALDYRASVGFGGTRQILFRWNTAQKGVDLLSRKGWIRATKICFKIKKQNAIPYGFSASIDTKESTK